MNSFDKYLQDKIYRLYRKQYLAHDTFEKMAKDWGNWYEKDEGKLTEWFRTSLGVGKERAKDYAKYVVAYLARTDEPKQESNSHH